MKVTLSIIAILIITSISAQNFTGKAIYKTSKKSGIKIGDDKNSKMSDDMKERIQARLQKMNQKTYILKFDKNTSTYKEQQALSTPKPQLGNSKVVVMSLGGNGSNAIYYKNIQQKKFSNQTEIMGKRFLVKDELPKYNWQMSTEKKNIGNYTCYKATYVKEVENKYITLENGNTVEQTKKETIVTTAWYTPQIPISNGPDNYQGLPGLILEINDGKNLIVCTEVILNPLETVIINEPTKGKVVSQKKIEEIQKEKSEEMMQKFKSRKGFDLGNGMNIKIGG